jgi:hypothetical protein
VSSQFLGSREERRMTRLHRDDILAGQPLVHLLLKRWADRPVLEGFDVHPGYSTEIVFGDGKRGGERGYGLGDEAGLRPLHVFVRAVGEEGFPDDVLPNSGGHLVIAHHQVRQDQRLRVVPGHREQHFPVPQQERGQVDERLYLVGTLLGSLADDQAARAVPDEHDRLGLRVQHPRVPVRIALQRDLRDRGPVVAVSREVLVMPTAEDGKLLRDLITDADALYWDTQNEVLIFGTVK